MQNEDMKRPYEIGSGVPNLKLELGVRIGMRLIARFRSSEACPWNDVSPETSAF